MPENGTEHKDVGAEKENPDAEKESSSSVPRGLKITAIVIPLVATFCGGVWTVMTQYSDLQKALQKEVTQQERLKNERVEQAVAEEKVKLDQQREATTRLQLEQQFLTASRGQEAQVRESLEQLKNHGIELQVQQSGAEKEIQKLKTEEQESRERASSQEFAQKQKDIERAEQTAKMASQSNDDQAVASAIASIMALDQKTAEGADAALALLLRYANADRYRSEAVAALETKASRLKSLEEAQLWLRVVRSINPPDFDLLVTSNRLARKQAERGAVAQFWALYADHTKEMPPDLYLRSPDYSRQQPFVTVDSLPWKEISSEIQKAFPENNRLTHEIVTQRLPQLLKAFSSDSTLAQLYTLLMEETGSLLVAYIESTAPRQAALDISDCYLPRPITVNSDSLIMKNLYIQLPGQR